MTVFNSNFPVRDEVDCPRHNLPLRLFHDPKLQVFRGIPLLHLHSLLKNDRTCIEILIDKMDRRSGQFDTAPKRCLVDFESVEAFSAELRDKCRVNIDYLIGIG